MKLKCKINGQDISQNIHPGEMLINFLRKNYFFGVKEGCETGECGSCLVLIDGAPRLSCIMLAAQVHERTITTIEGFGTIDNPHPLQKSFNKHGAIQCGYCTPAMVIAADTLLKRTSSPKEEEVRDALSGVLCRCTGYKKPVEAVMALAHSNIDYDAIDDIGSSKTETTIEPDACEQENSNISLPEISNE